MFVASIVVTNGYVSTCQQYVHRVKSFLMVICFAVIFKRQHSDGVPAQTRSIHQSKIENITSFRWKKNKNYTTRYQYTTTTEVERYSNVSCGRLHARNLAHSRRITFRRLNRIGSNLVVAFPAKPPSCVRAYTFATSYAGRNRARAKTPFAALGAPTVEIDGGGVLKKICRNRRLQKNASGNKSPSFGGTSLCSVLRTFLRPSWPVLVFQVSGNMVELVSNRMSCGTVYDFLDYLQPPSRQVTYELIHRHKTNPRDYVIDTSLLLIVCVVTSWLTTTVWITFACFVLLFKKINGSLHV